LNDGTDLIAALAPVAAVLNQLGVRFYVGGSVASSFHGAARSTWTLILSANWWQNMCLRSVLHSEMIFTSVSWQCELQFSGIPASA
jgi:hypothetical protein